MHTFLYHFGAMSLVIQAANFVGSKSSSDRSDDPCDTCRSAGAAISTCGSCGAACDEAEAAGAAAGTDAARCARVQRLAGLGCWVGASGTTRSGDASADSREGIPPGVKNVWIFFDKETALPHLVQAIHWQSWWYIFLGTHPKAHG